MKKSKLIERKIIQIFKETDAGIKAMKHVANMVLTRQSIQTY